MEKDKKKVLSLYARLFQKDRLEVTYCGGEANAAISFSTFGLDLLF